MTTEDLQAEVEKLQTEVEKMRDKNAQLLNEKKQAVGERDNLREQVETVAGERDKAAQELHNIKVDQPRQAVIEECAAPGMAGPLWRELTHHFDIENVEGREILQHKNGDPVTIASEGGDGTEPAKKTVGFDADGLKALCEADLVPGIGSMLIASRASGGGATGGGSGRPQPQTPAPKKGGNFGLR